MTRHRSALSIVPYLLLTLLVCSPARAQSKYRCSLDRAQNNITIERFDKKSILGKKSWDGITIQARITTITRSLRNKKIKLDPKTSAQLKLKKKQFTALLRFIKSCPEPEFPDITFSQIKPIIQTNCMACHATTGQWQNESEWFLASGKVAAGDPSGSILYTYLSDNPEGYAPAYMPKGLPSLSRIQIAKIRAWIVKLGAGVSGDRNTAYSCMPNSKEISTTPILRLAKVEYVNALMDLLSPLSTSDQLAAKTELTQALNLVPNDLAQHSFLGEQVFEKLDDRVLQEHVNAWKSVAETFGQTVTQTNARSLAISGGNCNPVSSSSCLLNFITTFGRRAYRRPLDGDEVADLQTFFAGRPSATAFRDLITRILMEPAFLYHLETEGVLEEGTSDVYTLSPYELASRLSFLFWQSIPSDELLALAGNGTLESDFDGTVDRVFFSGTGLERTKRTLEDFFIDWLKLEKIPVINPGNTQSFAAFAAGEQLDVGGTALRTDAQEEILSMVNHMTWERAGTLRELLSTDMAFTNSAPLAHLYGASPVTDGPEPMPAGNRGGLLLRAATLISGTHTSNPAKRGARFLRDFMCEDLPDPDPALMGLVKPPAEDPTLTTRQRYTRVSNSPACTGCHVRINPIGFALENFDALGRYRTEEKVFAADGSLLATLPINAKVGAVLFPGDVVPVNSGTELMNAIIDSGKVHACFARKYFDFAFRRHPSDTDEDNCLLEALRQAAVTGSLKDFFKNITKQEAFRKRRKGP